MSKSDLSYKGYVGSCEVSFEDECLHGRILFIEDLITYEGANPPELKLNFEAAVDRYLAYCEKSGKPANAPCSGSFNVRIGPELHRQALIKARLNGVNLNEFVKEAVCIAVADKKSDKVEHIHTHLIVAGEDVKDRIIATADAPVWETFGTRH